MCDCRRRVRVMRWFQAGRLEEHLRCLDCGNYTLSVRAAPRPVRTPVRH